MAWSDLHYGCSTRKVGIITLEIFFSRGAYHVRIGGNELKRTYPDVLAAQAAAERTCHAWLQDMLAQLEP